MKGVKYYSLQEVGQVNLLFTTTQPFLTQKRLLLHLKFVSAALSLLGRVCWEWLCLCSTTDVKVSGRHRMQAVGSHFGAVGENQPPGQEMGKEETEGWSI